MFKMNEAWHIPRASLSGSSSSQSAGSSSNSSSKSHSNSSTVTRHSRQLRTRSKDVLGHTNLAYHENEKSNKRKDVRKTIEKHGQKKRYDSSGQKINEIDRLPKTHNNREISKSNVNDSGIKRGSRSSQGSTDSSSSSHSGSSGSLLLTAANLERFAEIHKNSEEKQLYNANITISSNPDVGNTITESQREAREATMEGAEGKSSGEININSDTILAIDPNLHFVKTKDVDNVSIASSTHFTMVNGMGRSPPKPSSGICKRGHQITILIMSMSMIFLIGILAAVYVLEMRARVMPH